MNKKLLPIIIASALATTIAAPSATAQEGEGLTRYADDTSITVSGTVVEARSDEFDLLVGGNMITVEFEDEIRDGGAYTLLTGDAVTVSGLVDDDLFEGKELVANSIYIEKIDTSFIIDEEFAEQYGMVAGRTLTGSFEIAGNVTSTSDDEFRIHTNAGDFTVEVDDLANNPLDDEGYSKIIPGDWVSVVGHIDSDWLEGREIVASKVNLVRVGYVVD